MKLRKIFLAVSVLLVSAGLVGCGLQAIPQAKNGVEAAMAEVSNQYKRRADLVPNLVNVVKGYAAHEQQTLTAVVEARAKATQTTVNPGSMDPQKLQEYMNAQGSLSQALGRLMMVVEKYPELKADQNFRDLTAQLEGTENRITVARQRHIAAIQAFNDLVSVPPSNFTNMLFYHYDKLPQWSVAPEEQKAIESAPKVDFK